MDTVLVACQVGNMDLLALAQWGDRPLLDALGLEREAQLALKVVVPTHRALIVRVGVNDDLIDDPRLALRLCFLANQLEALTHGSERQQRLDVLDRLRGRQLGEQAAQVRVRFELVGASGLH